MNPMYSPSPVDGDQSGVVSESPALVAARAELARLEAEAQAEQQAVEERSATPDLDTLTDQVRELESRVQYLYEALRDQIAYHGQRNGPVAGTPAGGTGGLSV